VRELRNAIERAIVIARSDSITVDDLPERVRGGRPVLPLEENDAAALHAKEIKARVVDYEGKMIYDALRAAHGNQTEAAKRLGMPLRTLVRKVKALGLKVRVDK
jgi:DNA-binding NtrC family response regulator